MGPCNTTSGLGTDRPREGRSLYVCAEAEAQAYRWIQCQQAGYDLGPSTIREWVELHWSGFLRARWIEHLQGHGYWMELDDADYGRLPRELEPSPLLDAIMHRVLCGHENLQILNWAIETVLPMEEVIRILETVDINGRRMECQFANRLCRN